jgi:hypothetical protein
LTKGVGYLKFSKTQKENLIYSGLWYSTWREGQQLEINDIHGNKCLTVKISNKRFLKMAVESNL